MSFPFFSGFMGGGFWLFPLFGLTIMTIFLLLLFRVLSGRDRWGGPLLGHTYGDGDAESPADIPRRRYARGEISTEELNEIPTRISHTLSS